MKEFNLSKIKAAGTTVGDVYFPQTTLLLPFNGTNGATTTSDLSSKNNTVVFYGNAQLSTAQSKFGGSSLLLDGTGDYLQIANQSYFDFSTSDWTIECWFYLDSSTSGTYNTLLDMGNGSASGAGPYWTAVKNDSGTYYIGAALDSTTAGDWDVLNNLAISTLSADTWNHFAISRAGSNFKVFLNGTSVATGTSSSAMRDENSAVTIGARAQNTASNYFKGYIDDVRITTGVARYTSAFTAPTTAHLTSAGDVNKQIIVNSAADGVAVGTGGINQARIAKAWVNFNGTGTVAIRGSYNVSSITDNGTGIYTVNFSSNMSDTNYAVSGSIGCDGAASAGWLTNGNNTSSHTVNNTTSSCRVTCNYTTSLLFDPPVLSVNIFGN
jgi:hypothetical protein